MKLIVAGIGIVLCAAGLDAQQVKTTTTETTRFQVKDGRDLKVSGCVQPFEDAGYMLTDEAGDLKYVLVTNENLSKYTGHRVEVTGLGTDSDEGTLVIEKVVGTSGQFGDEKLDGTETKQTKEIAGDVGFAYLSVKSVKKVSNRCQ